VPAAGDNADVGKFGLVDIFPNAAKVAASSQHQAGAGIVITVGAEVEAYGAAYAGLTIGAGEDNRDWIAAFLNHHGRGRHPAHRQRRQLPSLRPLAGTPVGVAPAPALTAASNPTSGLAADDLPQGGPVHHHLRPDGATAP
jgi:hypothetical protein